MEYGYPKTVVSPSAAMPMPMPAPVAPAQPLPAAPMPMQYPTTNISVFELEKNSVYLAPKPMMHHPAAACCAPLHRPGMSAGVILVLFILLVIILRGFRV